MPINKQPKKSAIRTIFDEISAEEARLRQKYRILHYQSAIGMSLMLLSGMFMIKN